MPTLELREERAIGEELTVLMPRSLCECHCHSGGAPQRRQRRISRRQTGFGLTPHETRVLMLFVKGHSYQTAAGELGVSIHTISFHLRSIYGKLRVHSKTEAVAKALQCGLV